MPGLRREELALLAGVSASYYARLEQGHSLNASPEVLDAIARALRLDESERRHLHDLARSAKPHSRHRPAPERVTEATTQLRQSRNHRRPVGPTRRYRLARPPLSSPDRDTTGR